MGLTDSDRPRLANKVRLRHDRLTGKRWLLYPESGLLLDGASAEISALCDGRLTLTQLVDCLAARYTATPKPVIAQDVRRFLESLAARGLLHEELPP